MNSLSYFSNAFSQISADLSAETPSLLALRQQAMQHFLQLGLPTIKHEDWKYTRLNLLAEKKFTLPKKSCDLDLVTQNLTRYQLPPSSAQSLVFVDGYFEPSLSNISSHYQMTLMPLSQHWTQASPLLSRSHFEQQAFAALNTAFMQDGVYLSLSAATELNEPAAPSSQLSPTASPTPLLVQLLFFNTQTDIMSSPRNIVALAANTQATVIEQHIGLLPQAYWVNAVTEIHLNSGAKLEWLKLIQESDQAIHIAQTKVQQNTNSQFINHGFYQQGKLTRNDVNVQLCEPYASCELHSLYQVQGQQHLDQHTRIEHQQPHGKSREFYRGIIKDQGRAVFNGNIVVHPKAQRTDAKLTNNNLLLSEAAEIDTKPQLEIYADDVKCTHGATVGQLDAAAIFYLQSRGLSYDAAQALLIAAFAHEIIDLVKTPLLKEFLATQLTQTMQLASI